MIRPQGKGGPLWRGRNNPVKARFTAGRLAKLAAKWGAGPEASPRDAETGSGSIRECRAALWAGAGGPARPLVPHRAAFLPVSHRAVRRRQDLAFAAAVP